MLGSASVGRNSTGLRLDTRRRPRGTGTAVSPRLSSSRLTVGPGSSLARSSGGSPGIPRWVVLRTSPWLGSRFLPLFSLSLLLLSSGRALTSRLTGTTRPITSSFSFSFFPPLRPLRSAPLSAHTPDNGPLDHVRTPSDVAFRLAHSGSPALRPFHGLWPRLGCCSPLAVCRAPSTVYGHGWGAARRSPLAGAWSPRRADAAGPGCSRRRLLLFRPQALLAARCCLVLPSPPRGVAIVVDWGTRLRLPPAHIFVPGRRALGLALPLHWMVWRADAAPGRTLGQC